MLKQIYQVDSFTNKIFKGNPAAVCFFVSDESDEWMQAMAAEMNLSETAFLKKLEDGYQLRWFTPTQEVQLCGHATLAAAHTLWENGELAENQEAKFHTVSGVLKATKDGEWITLDFPIEEDQPVAVIPPELIEGLKTTPLYVGKNRMDYIVEVESAAIVRNMVPDIAILSKLDTQGIIVTSKSDSAEYDFISRYFGPGCGIDEDPVTGSAHCCSGPYWQRKTGKSEFKAYQASKRGGELKVKVGTDRVYLMGQAKTVFSGEVKN